MPRISHSLNLLRARPQSVCLFCQSLPSRPFFSSLTASRNLSISSTSIKAALPTVAKDEKAITTDGLARLARVGFANEARVMLAMRGLEGQDSGVRVAVLGRSGSEGRLVAALLADPLSTKLQDEKRWMNDLLLWSSSLPEGKKGALLIRYGPFSPITTPPGSPISFLSIPSPLLKISALEILLAPLPSSQEDLAIVTLHATEIPGARIIEYPVHKTLFWAGEGPAGLSTLLNQSCASTGPVLKALSLPDLSTAATPEETDVKIIDLTIAEDAITQLQSSIENATTFEHEWIQGGLETIRKWIVSGTSKNAASGVKPAVKTLVSSIISEAELLIRQEEVGIVAAKKVLEDRVTSASSPTPDDVVTLSRALKGWSQTAHSELQEGLCTAFKSKPWKSLAWWKLLWAVDDVTNNSQDVLAAGFLPESKKKLLFLAGRFSGAGLHGYGGGDTPSSTPMSVEEELEEIRKSEQLLSSVSKDRCLGGVDYCPPQIFSTTNYILADVIPRLQASANKLLVRAFSVSSTGVAISSILYLSEFSIYSSSSIAALSVMYGARYLQKEWDKEKNWFQSTVAEKGRIAIVETERWGWERLKVGREFRERVEVGGEGLRKMEEGKKIVGDVKRALEKL